MNSAIINEAFLQRVERLQTLLKNNIAGLFGGNHQSKSFGSSCEFADYRNYIPGDDITKIDWNAYARFETLYLKLYLDERQLHTRIYIDASRSMDYGKGKKGARALEMAATLAYLSVCELDRVSIYTIRESEVTTLIDGMVGKDRFYNEIGKLNDIEFDGDCFISEGMLPTKVGYGDGLSIIISDFLSDNDYERAIDYLAEKKRDLLCIQVLSEEEVNPSARGKNHFYDSEHPERYYRRNINRDILNAYREAVQYVQNRIRNYCNAREASFLLVSDERPMEQIFFEYLTQTGVLK